jgi:hypothetical protein
MSAAGADGFVGWLLAAIDGVMDAERVGPDAAGSVRAELAKFAGAGRVRALRACRNGGRVDAMLVDETGSRWAVVAGLDDQDMVAFLWVQREPAAFAGVPGGLVVVLNGPSSSGKSTLATAIQQAADTPWIRLLPDEFFQWHLPERYGAFGRAAGPWQEGFFAPSSLVRSMVVHACTLHLFDRQWAIDLVAAVAASDKSAKLRESAAAEIRWLRKRWESDDRRRELDPGIVARTERHGGRWIVIRDGRVVATPGKAGRVFRRELSSGGRQYWVAPPGTSRPRIP